MLTFKDHYENFWETQEVSPDRDPTTPDRKRLLIKILLKNIRPGERVLDLGCGSGKFCALLQEQRYLATGVEISENAIQVAHANFPDFDFRLLKENGRIPAEDGEFSAVWSSEVIEHVFDVHGYLSEVNRVLRPQGLFILTTPFHGILKNIIIAIFKFDRHFAPEGEHIRFFNKAGLKLCLERAGFEPLLWKGIGRIPPLYRTWFVVAKKIQTSKGK